MNKALNACTQVYLFNVIGAGQKKEKNVHKGRCCYKNKYIENCFFLLFMLRFVAS